MSPVRFIKVNANFIQDFKLQYFKSLECNRTTYEFEKWQTLINLETSIVRKKRNHLQIITH